MNLEQDRNEIVKMVTEFWTTFGQNPSINLQLNNVQEELAELKDELEQDVINLEATLKEVADVIYTMIGLDVVISANKEALEADPLMNVVIMITMVEAVELSAAIEKLFNNSQMVEAVKLVHASNMTKLGPDGPIFREDGKILKGPNYVKPDLSALVAA